jgi:hydrogenase maturation protease
MPRTLVVGYGNVDREDDGVAYHVVNALRRRLGQEPLAHEDTGLEGLGRQVDSIWVIQLAPELLDVAVDYGRLILVDAHVQAGVDDLVCYPVQPEYTSSAFTHHIGPAMFLALLQALYHREPAACVVSIRGHNFDFGRDLSAATGALVEPAAERILQLLAGQDDARCLEE